MDHYIGFDISDKKTVICMIDELNKEVYDTVDTEVTALQQWLRRQRRPGRKLHLTFEVCGQAGHLYDGLLGEVDSLAVSNPHEMTWIYRTGRKSDRIDARKQARLLKMGEVPAVHMPAKEIRQWRQQIQHRRRLVDDRTQKKNRIKALVKSQGYKTPEYGKDWWAKKNRPWLDQLADQPDFAPAFELRLLLEQLDLLDRQIAQATEHLDRRLAQHKDGNLLQTIPGVGPRTTEAVLAYADDIQRFATGKQFGSYFGMTPKLDQSGAMCRHGHISKRGPAAVRWLIVESAWRVLDRCPQMRAVFDRICKGQPGRRKVAIVAVARKLLTVMRVMLLSGKPFDASRVGQPPKVSGVEEEQVESSIRHDFYSV